MLSFERSVLPYSTLLLFSEPRRKILVSCVSLQVTNNGWAEGECKGEAGWFPFEFVERRDRVLASKVAEVF